MNKEAMMIKSYSFRLLIILTILLVGCNSSLPTSSATDTPTLPPTHVIQPSPTLTKVPTLAPTISPSPTPPIISPITTTAISSKVISNCLSVQPGSSGNLKLKGTLLLTPIDIQSEEPSILYNIETREKKNITSENERAFDFSVTPDHSLMAYRQWVMDQAGKKPVKDSLVIANSSGEILKEIPYGDEEHWALFDWVNNQQLLILGASWTLDPMIFLNPITGQIQEIKAWGTYPGIEMPGGPWGTAISYNKAITFGIYSGRNNDIKQTLNLWDVQNGRLITDVITYIGGGTLQKPTWSPDDTQAAVARFINYHRPPPYDNELFSINQNGQIARLTYLTDVYQDRISIGYFSWSPDNQSIAFWFDINDNDETKDQLAVVNIADKIVTNYCIQGGTKSPIWSMDSRYLFLESSISESTNQVIAIDLEKNLAVQIIKNMQLAGWLEKAK